MNFKTTIGLGIAVVVLSAVYLIVGADPGAESQDSDINGDGAVSSVSSAGSEAEGGRSLSKPPLDDDSQIVEVVYERRGKPRMVFQRVDQEDSSGSEKWMMVEPTRCQASSWTVSDIALAAKRLEYASKYNITGPDSVSLEDVGIRPEPSARFAVTSQEGEAVEFEVGNALIGQRKRYVFLPARPDTVFVAEEDFKAILDRELTQYREKNLFRLVTADAVALEVTARGEDKTTTYELKKQKDEWLFVAPFKAKAESKKIRGVINAMNSLWASSWVEDVPASLAEFGLDDPYLLVKVTTEKVIEKPEAEPAESEESPVDEQAESEAGETVEPEDEPAPEKEIEREQFVLLLSDRKPIDDDKKIYVNAARTNRSVPWRRRSWRRSLPT